jgi:hypothetical protein
MPIACPSTQWFGSGFGQSGSTSKRGATRPAADAVAAVGVPLAALLSVAAGAELVGAVVSQAASSSDALAR